MVLRHRIHPMHVRAYHNIVFLCNFIDSNLRYSLYISAHVHYKNLSAVSLRRYEWMHHLSDALVGEPPWYWFHCSSVCVWFGGSGRARDLTHGWICVMDIGTWMKLTHLKFNGCKLRIMDAGPWHGSASFNAHILQGEVAVWVLWVAPHDPVRDNGPLQ